MQITMSMFSCSKTDPDILPKVLSNLAMLLQDNSVVVVKRVILAVGQLLKVALLVCIYSGVCIATMSRHAILWLLVIYYGYW